MKHFYEGGDAMPNLKQKRTFLILINLKTYLYSFKCLLLSLSTYCYQFSCNVQESRASGTTGYGWGRRGADGRSIAAVLLTIFCVLFISLVFTHAAAQTQTELVLRGEVRSAADGQAIEGASIIVDKKHARTDKEGRFTISVSKPTGTLTLNHIGYNEQKIAYENTATILKISLEISSKQIEEVEVVSTGFQKIPKERATGSFEFIDSALFNRKVSTDVLSRLEDIVPSISRDKSFDRGKRPFIGIRGVSTLNSNSVPLLVIDGVPYQTGLNLINGSSYWGDFNNINPNDIENITVLKDAAASSIWGAQAGNGVIVITTKRGKYNQPVKLSFNSNVTVDSKPDLYYLPQMSSKDYISLERELFEKGAYDYKVNDIFNRFSPSLLLLIKNQKGLIPTEELNEGLETLSHFDTRKDFMKYVYRNAVKQQYNMQLSGGSDKINYIFSIGYDRNLEGVHSADFDRLNLKSFAQLKPLKNLELGIGLGYNSSTNHDAGTVNITYGNLLGGNYPYTRLADEFGNALVVDGVGPNPMFLDTLSTASKLLDWKYRPLDDIKNKQLTVGLNEILADLNVDYELPLGIKAQIRYNYRNQQQILDSWKGVKSFSMRDQINGLAEWDATPVKWNLPIGDHLYKMNTSGVSHQGRFMFSYDKSFDSDQELSMIAGSEVKDVKTYTYSTNFWGYDRESMTSQPVDFVNFYPWANGILGSTKIFNNQESENRVSRFTSYFANASYTYRKQFSVSGSLRKDASNLFGVKTNNKGKPFWSIGGAWNLQELSLLSNSPIIDRLKIRATYGFNGNVNNTVSAYPIMYVSPYADNVTGDVYSTMMSPPNPNLRWENVGMLNLGLDFSLFTNRISGAIEYYIKRPKDLISISVIDPTNGFKSLMINSADLRGEGVDISLSAKNIHTRVFRWSSNLVFAYSRTKVTKSSVTDRFGKNYLSGNRILTPFEGADVYSALGFTWKGLDHDAGRPIGVVNGQESTDYSAIYNRTDYSDMSNKGTMQPLYFGSLRNTFNIKSFELSFNIAYQLGHKFRRKSFNSYFFWDSELGHSDYADRWQKPGDENRTDVPAMIYPIDYNADQFYTYSSALLTDASIIKLRDIQLSYRTTFFRKHGGRDLRIYAYINNVATLWRANRFGIDPEYGNTYPDPRSYSLGISFNL